MCGVCDWFLVCEGGVVVEASGDGEEKAADLGRPSPGPGDAEPALEKGLFRCDMVQLLVLITPSYTCSLNTPNKANQR